MMGPVTRLVITGQLSSLVSRETAQQLKLKLTSKLGISLFDVAESHDQLLTGDIFLILEPISLGHEPQLVGEYVGI